jgi:trehalose synthase-fused probable maltokinase
MLTALHTWARLFEGETAAPFMTALPDILRARRWFGGKARRIRDVGILDRIAIPSDSLSMLLLIRVEYEDGPTETYTLPVSAAFGGDAEHVRRDMAPAVIAPFVLQKDSEAESGLLYDALWSRDCTLALLRAVSVEGRFTGTAGSVTVSCTDVLGDLLPAGLKSEPVVMRSEQSNTSVAYDAHVILKVYRRVQEGINPDLEIGRVLTRLRFPHAPLLGGALEYHAASGSVLTLGVLQQFVANEGTAWHVSLEAVKQFFERIDSEHPLDELRDHSAAGLLGLASEPYPPRLGRHLAGGWLEWTERLGQRTAELHDALSGVSNDPAFAPEPLTPDYGQSRHATLARDLAQALTLLQGRRTVIPGDRQTQTGFVSELMQAITRTIDAFAAVGPSVPRIRCHGDYHLGQVLCTGENVMIIDFEGEPARSLTERRMKHPVLLDLAGMIRSFYYVPSAFLKGRQLSPSRWASFWSGWMSVAFLKGYLNAAEGSDFWPRDTEDVYRLLDFYLLEKTVYELSYELNNRPDWIDIPLEGLVALLNADTHST